MIHVMWKYKIDPDNAAIPFLTALGDLFGSCFLAIAFVFMISIGSPYISTSESKENVTVTMLNATWGE